MIPKGTASSLCDPQNNYTTDRIIEIYNSGPGAVDLTGWSVIAVANNVDVTTWSLSGTLAAGQAKVCGGPTTVTGFTVHFQSAVWATPAGYMNWNGKVGDGAKLVDASATVIDRVLATGTLFENSDLVRHSNITSPNPVFTPGEWTSTPVLLATNTSPGTHDGSLPPPGGPVISSIATDPAVPVTGAGADVQVSVVDTSAELTGVTLAWGTTSGSQPNIIGMPLLSGTTYRTSAPIPAQSGSVTVYYKVQASDSATTTTSAIQSYTLAGGGGGAPTVLTVGEMSDSTLLVTIAIGLYGSALRVALHNIIKNHTVTSYSYALTAFGTTDIKPDGKIWDPYSDVPGGTPPYEYSFGQTGQGATEGLGYNREHSWPQSWFGGVSPPYSDLWILYPTDAKVNGYRANYPYGKVGTATTTSLNGSKLGSSASAGYSGTVFEPIDPFKGDLARSQFYVATRYFNEDAGWPGSPSATGSQLVPWAAQQYLQWSTNDPVSWKERLRNGAIYVISHNRNPFVDHPEFVAMIYDSNSVAGVDGGSRSRSLSLHQNLPNPFGARTTIGFDLARRGHVTLRIYDVTGRLVRALESGSVLEAGGHSVEWNGRDDGGALLKAGLYFCRLDAGAASATRRMVFAR